MTRCLRGANRFGLMAVGRETFRLTQTQRRADGLYEGQVAWLPPLPPQALRHLLRFAP